MKKKIIGTKYLTYAEKRCIALPFKDYEVKRIADPYVLLSSAHRRLVGRLNFTWVNLHTDLNLDSCYGYHFWNAASYSSKPWVTTLELPTNDRIRLKLFAREQCRKILCLSKWVLDTQRGFLESSDYASKILPKLELLHPPQDIYKIEKNEPIDGNEVVKFIFIGRDFFRKGGFECVKAFDKVLENGHNAELTIISKLDRNDWPHPATEEELASANATIEKWKQNIHVFREIGHGEVMELIAKSHVGLLPTYNDSYGYSVLEFFSHGLPAITTEVLAQSEINHIDRGWLLNLPVKIDEYGVKEFERSTLEQRNNLSDLLTDAIHQKICSILENKQEIEARRIPALQYIRGFHNVDRYKKTLEDIYSTFA
jgi:glycosyltransferase involved in cell wall biosynthesis